MPKPTHRNVKFSKEEMEYDIPDDLDLGKLRYVGRGVAGMAMAKRISRAHGEEKRKIIGSLPQMQELSASSPKAQVQLDPDVAKVFGNSMSVNRALRALIQAWPVRETRKHRKSA
jgi:hypothetical protein